MTPEQMEKLVLLTSQQRQLRDQLQDIGLIAVIEEATGRRVPTLEDVDHRHSDYRDYREDHIGPAKYHPQNAIASVEGDRRSWDVEVLSLVSNDRGSREDREDVVDERLLGEGVRPALLALRFTLEFLNAGTPMAHSQADLYFNGHVVSIDGERKTYFDRIPNSSETQVQDIDQALGMALMHPEIIPSQHYSR